MVNPGRVACIFTPFVLSLGALVCLVLIFLAGTIHKNDTVDDLYFLKIDLTNFTQSTQSVNLDPSVLQTGNLSTLEGALLAAKQSLGLQDYYTIYLRNYCGWNGNSQYSNCTSPSSFFYFNPDRVWGLDSIGVDTSDYLPDSFRAGLATYEGVSKAMFVLYCAALTSVSATLLVGITAIFSRWGSLFTSFFAGCGTMLFLVASIMATILFEIVKSAFNKTLNDDFGIESTVGTKSLSLTWIGTAFAVAAGLFWTLSICCCSGRSPYHYKDKEGGGFGGMAMPGRGRGRTKAERTPYTYERVGSPYLGPSDSQAVPLNTLNHSGYQQTGPSHSAYEPFRPQQV